MSLANGVMSTTSDLIHARPPPPPPKPNPNLPAGLPHDGPERKSEKRPWLVGAVFLFHPPRSSLKLEQGGLPVHAVAERERRLAAYRAAEEKWAKRCLWAWVAVVCVAVVVSVGLPNGA